MKHGKRVYLFGLFGTLLQEVFGQWAWWVLWLGLVEFVSLLVSFSCQFHVYSVMMCRTVQGTLQRIRRALLCSL